jgi:uncharacterized protein (DUF1501 family)
MLDFGPSSHGNCSGVTRRSLLKAGFLGLAGVSLADVMRARAAAGTQSSDDLSIILIWLDGGPPQHETYDPKPDAPEGIRGPLGVVKTSVPGILLSDQLPEHARLMHKMAIIRSMHHNNDDHFAAAHWMLTGYLGSNAVNMAPQYPSAGSVIAKLKGAKQDGVPPYVGLPNTHSVGLVPGYHGAAYLGHAYNPFSADGDPNGDGYKAPGLTLPGELTIGRLEDRRGLLGAFDQVRTRAEAHASDTDRFTQQAFEMLTSERARQAFELSRENPRLRDRYGRHTWGQSALLARRLVEAGVRFVTLTFGGWDYHSNLDKGMRNVLPVLDHAVATLVDDLDQRGRLANTMVLVMGEFGRTPRINKGLPQDPVPGRDHWGRLMSVLVAGGGVRGGTLVGSSNARGESPRELPVTPKDLVATLYDRLGIPNDTTFYDRVNRPIPVFPHGATPIRELLA